mmetsp:Transcript_167575/g.538141  ORF Transcript_167575/g.538141 Transcript_167575/m.538141 type:complete len:208 (+) Transcript_167575:1520-2143(+)
MRLRRCLKAGTLFSSCGVSQCCSLFLVCVCVSYQLSPLCTTSAGDKRERAKERRKSHSFSVKKSSNTVTYGLSDITLPALGSPPDGVGKVAWSEKANSSSEWSSSKADHAFSPPAAFNRAKASSLVREAPALTSSASADRVPQHRDPKSAGPHDVAIPSTASRSSSRRNGDHPGAGISTGPRQPPWAALSDKVPSGAGKSAINSRAA